MKGLPAFPLRVRSVTMPDLPTARHWLFSGKVFAAAMLALYIALALGLPRPYWAMATVYLVSHPLTGATRSKSIYRVAGTVMGATAAVILLPWLVNEPMWLMSAIALWVAALIYLSLLDRTPRSYAFLLAAYTLPIVALPAVSDPTSIFDVALARLEEIVLGIVCASMVGALAFPESVSRVLRDRADAWLGDISRWVDAMLDPSKAGTEQLQATRHRLAADILALDHLIVQLGYDAEGTAAVLHARALHARMTLLLPVMSAVAETLAALYAEFGGVPPSLRQRLEMWKRGGETPAKHDEWPDDRLNLGEAVDYHHQLVAAAHYHLTTLAELWSDCLTLRDGIGDVSSKSLPVLRYRGPEAARAFFHDHGMSLFYASSAGIAVFVAGLAWILSGWVDGAGAVGLAALTSSFFATSEEPHKLAWAFVKCSGVCLLVSWFFQFAVLPHAHDFGSLAGLLALPYLVIGALIPRPGFGPSSVLLSVNAASFANVQSVYETSFIDIFNGSLASFAAMLFAPVWVLATRPFGVHIILGRMRRAGWKDLATAADFRQLRQDPRIAGRMLDRFCRLAPRLAAQDGNEANAALRELQAGFSLLALQAHVRALPPSARRATLKALHAVNRHYRRRVNPHLPGRPSDELAARLEAAVQAIGCHVDAASRDAMTPLLSLQLALFPVPRLHRGSDNKEAVLSLAMPSVKPNTHAE
ncbi:conserved membrane protein of unknown function (plasmid) [Cupriavidus taiwanensis]|uniref:Transporter n=1 Tax=Cupriavidus taiwanensis TaxID=164546 RepID=A0A375IMV0_9BURK|nr:FUSC family protein [Cupriavidus taiwanensis]SPK75964.1 conserved membrane protein of unknown function [Cupriavidus taiwanensis]